MTLKETLTQLEALGNEKMRKQNAKKGAGGNQFGVRLGDIRTRQKRLRPITSWPCLYGRLGTLTPDFYQL